MMLGQDLEYWKRCTVDSWHTSPDMALEILTLSSVFS